MYMYLQPVILEACLIFVMWSLARLPDSYSRKLLIFIVMAFFIILGVGNAFIYMSLMLRDGYISASTPGSGDIVVAMMIAGGILNTVIIFVIRECPRNVEPIHQVTRARSIILTVYRPLGTNLFAALPNILDCFSPLEITDVVREPGDTSVDDRYEFVGTVPDDLLGAFKELRKNFGIVVLSHVFNSSNVLCIRARDKNFKRAEQK